MTTATAEKANKVDLDKIEIGSDGRINAGDPETEAAIKSMQERNQTDALPSDDLKLCVSGCGDTDVPVTTCYPA